MAAAKTKTNAAIAALKKAAEIGLHVAGWAPVYYVGKVNLSASASQGEAWANASIVATLFAAIVFEVAILFFKRGRLAAGGVMLAVSFPFLALSTLVASGNVASIDKGASEARSAQSTAANMLSDRRADAVARRDEAKKAAAGETEQSALNKIEKTISENSSTWQKSEHCDADHITLPLTKFVCGNIAALKVKAAAAKAYAAAVKEIEDLDGKWDTKTTGAPVQSTGEGASANLVAFAAMAGHDLGKDNAAKIFEWWRGGCLELMGAMSPGLMNLFAWLLFGAAEDKAPEAPKRRASTPMSEPKPKGRAWLASFVSSLVTRPKPEAEIIAFPAGSAREFHRRFLEPSDDPKSKIRAGDIQKRYAEDCARHGVEPLDAKVFSQALQALVQYSKTAGGRPYYHGVKWRDAPLPAVMPRGPRIAVDNTLGTVSGAAAAWG